MANIDAAFGLRPIGKVGSGVQNMGTGIQNMGTNVQNMGTNVQNMGTNVQNINTGIQNMGIGVQEKVGFTPIPTLNPNTISYIPQIIDSKNSKFKQFFIDYRFLIIIVCVLLIITILIYKFMIYVNSNSINSINNPYELYLV